MTVLAKYQAFYMYGKDKLPALSTNFIIPNSGCSNDSIPWLVQIYLCTEVSVTLEEVAEKPSHDLS